MCSSRQWLDVYAWIAADQADEVVGVTSKHDRWAGAECGRGHEGVYRVAGVKPITTQQVSSASRDRTVGVDHGQPSQYLIDSGAARCRAGYLSDHRSGHAGPTAQPLYRDEHRLRPAGSPGALAGKRQRG